MSDFHFSDENQDSSKPSKPAQPEPKSPSFEGAETLPQAPSPFHLDDEDAPKTDAQAKAGAKPLGGAPKPRPQVKPAISSLSPEQEAAKQRAAATAATLANSEPVDAFSAFLAQFGSYFRKVFDALETPAAWLLRVSIPLGVLCLAYILAATFMGGTKVPTNPKFPELVKNLALAATGLKWCLVAAATSALILGYDDRKWGAIVAFLGGVFHFLLPLGAKILVGNNAAGATVGEQLRATGFLLLVIGLVKATGDLLAFLFELPNKIKARYAQVGAGRAIEEKQKRIARDANMFSPCWNLPFCREAIRKMCPAFLARQTCWKFGRGCYCDEEMIARIVRNEPIEAVKAPTRMSKTKPPCGRCYIYLEHQTYKFRMLSPLALPASVALMFFAWPVYATVFGAVFSRFDSLWSSLSFSATNLTPDAIKASQRGLDEASRYAASPETTALWAQNMIGVVLGFVLLIYISKFIEWAIFKAKL